MCVCLRQPRCSDTYLPKVIPLLWYVLCRYLYGYSDMLTNKDSIVTNVNSFSYCATGDTPASLDDLR